MAGSANHYDVIVVGVGAMGSSACWHLARRGVRVLGLEQFAIPHDRGSSHGFTRMIRTAYYEHPDYVPLLRRSWAIWRELEEESKQPLLHATGGLYLGPAGSEIVDRSRAAAEAHGLKHEMFDRAAIARRYPQFHVPDQFVALYERDAGFLRPERCITAFVAGALRHGAEIHGNEGVLDWSSDDGGVRVTTARGTYHAEHLVFAAGAWSDRLVRDLGIELRVTRQAMGWVQPIRPELFTIGTLPVWAIDHLDGTIHYGFPIIEDVPGFMIAHHAPAERADPDTVDRAPRAGDEQSFRPVLRQNLPDADGPLLAIRICLYTSSPDSHFIIDAHPARRRVTLACGFSGHGFKFAAVVGEALADLATRGRSELPVEFLRLARFQ